MTAKRIDIVKSILFDIFIGVITGAVCELIKIIWNKLTNTNKTEITPPYHSLKTLTVQYYISALVCIIIFIILARFDTHLIGRTILVVLFFISVFLNWSAFECMHEIVNYFKSNFKGNDGKDNN